MTFAWHAFVFDVVVVVVVVVMNCCYLLFSMSAVNCLLDFHSPPQVLAKSYCRRHKSKRVGKVLSPYFGELLGACIARGFSWHLTATFFFFFPFIVFFFVFHCFVFVWLFFQAGNEANLRRLDLCVTIVDKLSHLQDIIGTNVAIVLLVL